MSLIAHFDLWTGLAGDMWVGAFLDAGWPESRLQEGVAALHLPEIQVTVETRKHQGLVGRGIVVTPPEGHIHRGLTDILKILESSDLPEAVAETAGRVFRRIAEAEARVHGSTVDRVHFHEVGAHDSIVDIAMAVLAVHDLQVTVTAGDLPITGGEVKMAHGRWPVPAPATALLLEGWPVRPEDVEGEFITPTGAALLAELATHAALVPAMSVQKVGYGAGTRDHPLRPNVVRLWIGTAENGDSTEAEGAEGAELKNVVVLETQVDDMDPRWFASLADSLLSAGALDVFSEAISMKKGRWGTRLTVVCRAEGEPALLSLIFRNSTTLGIRRRTESRWELARDSKEVETPWGVARLKWTIYAGERSGRFESDDILRLADDAGLAAAEMEQRLSAWWAELPRDGNGTIVSNS